MKITHQEMKHMGVDFDDTIAHNTGYPDYSIGEPIKGAREGLETLTERGFKIVIYTARPSVDYKLIEDWLIENNMPFNRIVTGKELLVGMIDDKNVEFDGDWGKTLEHNLCNRNK